MVRISASLALGSLLLFACGPEALTPGGGLGLRFAQQAIDAPCPEVAAADPTPPSLDRLEVRLFRSDGQKHFTRVIKLDQGATATLKGIPRGEDLLLQITGFEGEQALWQGAAEHIAIRDGRSTYADVFMTRISDMSCTLRPLQRPRAHMASALTGTGKVLMAGGLETWTDCGPGCAQARASAAVDLFDPGSGYTYVTQRLHTPRALATATTLADGKVLVVGGVAQVTADGSAGGLPFQIDPDDLVPSFEVYLPAEGIWIEKPLPGGGRVFHTATLLDDGRVLVVGGGPSIDDARTDAILFDPAGESVGDFSPVVDNLDSPRLGHAAIALPGRVLIIGGAVLTTRSAVEEFTYDGGVPIFSEVVVTGDSANLFFHNLSPLPLRPDELLLTGGSFYDGMGGLLVPSVDNTRIFSISQSRSSATEPMNSPRMMHGAVLLGNDQVLLAGGYSDLALTPDDGVEAFDPAGGFRAEAALSIARGGHALVGIEGGRALAAGGLGPDGILGSGEIFTPQAGQ